MPILRFSIPLPMRRQGVNAGKPYPLESGNGSFGRREAHAARRRKHRDRAERIATAVRERQGMPPAEGRRTLRLTLVRGKHQRILDVDNAEAGLKPYVDGIRRAGLIRDDSEKWCERPRVRQVKVSEPVYELRVEVEWPD